MPLGKSDPVESSTEYPFQTQQLFHYISARLGNVAWEPGKREPATLAQQPLPSTAEIPLSQTVNLSRRDRHLLSNSGKILLQGRNNGNALLLSVLCPASTGLKLG